MLKETELPPNNQGIALPVDLIRTVAVVLVILLHAAIEPTPNTDIMSAQGMNFGGHQTSTIQYPDQLYPCLLC